MSVINKSLDEIALEKALRYDEAIAERDAALASLEALVRAMRREGGYCAPLDQIALREAIALLEEQGRRIT